MFKLSTVSVATLAGGSGADPPDPGRDDEAWRVPKDKAIMRKLGKTHSGLQKKGGKETARSSSSGSRSSRHSSISHQNTWSFSEGDEGMAAEPDDGDRSSMQSSGFLDRSATGLQRSDGVSRWNSVDSQTNAIMEASGAPSPVISRANSMEHRPVGQRSNSLLSEIPEEYPSILGSAGGRRGRDGRRPSALSQESELYCESPSPATLQRQPHTRRRETPVRSMEYAPTGRRQSEPDSPEQTQVAGPTDGAAREWVRNRMQYRDSVRAGRDRYVADDLDIQTASGSAFDYVKGARSYLSVEEDQQANEEEPAETKTKRKNSKIGKA